MALKSRNTAVAVTLQSARDSWNAPNSTTDLMVISQLRPSIDAITVANDEYTGSVFQNADAVAGKRVTFAFNVKMRPPSALPDADAWVPGRILQSAKMSEVRLATAVPAAAEAVGVGSTTTSAVLGTSASGTDSIYRMYPLSLSDNGASVLEKLTLIREYVGASKAAELMETLSGAPAANYQIPTFIAYYRDVTSDEPPVMSWRVWIDGFRYDLINVAVTGMRWTIPVSTNQQAAFPEFQFTVDATIYATADEATPSIPSLGSIPLFKNGDMHLNKVAFGGDSIDIDYGLQADFPPNPNQPDGVDAPEIAGGTANGTLRLQKYLKAKMDLLSIADAQTYHPFFAQWGTTAGKIVQIGIPDARFGFPGDDMGGNIVMTNLGLYVDVLDRNLGVVFPYPA